MTWEEFRSCRFTFHATAAPWNDMSRGATQWIDGPDEMAKKLGMDGVISPGPPNEDEGLYPVQHAYWVQVMKAALAGKNPATTVRGGEHVNPADIN